MNAFRRSLHFDQGPPLAIPLCFFFTSPVALACAGGLLLRFGSALLATPWLPLTMSLTHLATLGFLAMVMMGALYQITPVLAGTPVPRVRLAHAVHALFVAGVAGLCWGTAFRVPRLVFHSIALLSAGLVLFVVPAAIALRGAATRTPTVRGLQLALVSFFLTVSLGIWMAHGHAGMDFPGVRSLWIQVHVSVALIGWVGGLIAAVSWQVLPMFYLTQRMDARVQRAVLLSVPLLLVLPVGVLLADYAAGVGRSGRWPASLAALGALPALLVVWGVQPMASLRALRTRRRPRVDGSLLFWQAGLCCAPLVALSGLVAWSRPEPRLALLFGWLALFGWSGMIVHGMLTRIVPFLVWFHRFAPVVGVQRVPSAKELLPDRWTRTAFGLHVATVALGAAAILTRSDALARVLGLSLLAVAASLAGMLGHVTSKRAPRSV